VLRGRSHAWHAFALAVASAAALPCALPSSPVTHATSESDPAVTVSAVVGGPITAVHVDGDVAWVVQGPSLVGYDLGRPDGAVEIGRTSALDDDLHLGGGFAGYVFVSGFQAGLMAFDVRDPRHPVEVARVATDLGGRWPMVTVDAQARTAYVMHPRGWLAFDVRDPRAPREIGTVRPTSAGGLRTTGGRLLLVGDAGTELLEPVPPWRTLSSVTTSTVYDAVAVGDRLVVIVAEEDTFSVLRLAVFDVADPTRPRRLGHAAPAVGAKCGISSLAVVDTRAYVGTECQRGGMNPQRSTIQVIDLANPAAPRSVSLGQFGGGAAGMAVWRGSVIVAAQQGGLWRVGPPRGSDPDTRRLVPTLGWVTAVAVAGGIAYVASVSDEPEADDQPALHAFDLRFAPPLPLGSLDLFHEVPSGGIDADGTLVAAIQDVGPTSTLWLIDAHDPRHLRPFSSVPELRGVPSSGGDSSVLAGRGTVYVVGFDSVTAIDVRDPARPLRGGSIAIARASDAALGSDALFVTTYLGDVVRVDVSVPAAPRTASTFALPWAGPRPARHPVAARGDILFVDTLHSLFWPAQGSAEVLFDADLPGRTYSPIADDGRFVFVPNASSYPLVPLAVFDARDPAAPVRLSVLDASLYLRDIDADGSDVVAVGENALYVLRNAARPPVDRLYHVCLPDVGTGRQAP
jgi:hypothetical protein